MAVALGTLSTTAYTTATSIVITKPTSLAVGDMMIAQLTGGNQYSTPSGWTSIGFLFADTALMDVFAKVADSADVAATNFTFSSGVSNQKSGSIYRITGAAQDVAFIQSSSNTRTDSVTATYTVSTGITPTYADSLLMMLVAKNQGGAASSFGTYAIATSNPSWTEQVDVNDGGTEVRACATAIRPEITATGNATVVITGLDASTDAVSWFLVIPPKLDVSVSPTVVVLTSTVPLVLIITSIALTGTVLAPSLILENGKWTNTAKNSSTWLNTDKT